jgi:hypothetical protein
MTLYRGVLLPPRGETESKLGPSNKFLSIKVLTHRDLQIPIPAFVVK